MGEGKVKGTHVDELQFVDGAADADGEEEDVALQPRDFGAGVFEADAGAGHGGGWSIV